MKILTSSDGIRHIFWKDEVRELEPREVAKRSIARKRDYKGASDFQFDMPEQKAPLRKERLMVAHCGKSTGWSAASEWDVSEVMRQAGSWCGRCFHLLHKRQED